MDADRLLRRVDRLAAGRQAGHRADPALLAHPGVQAAFRRVTRLLVTEFVIGGGAVVEAVVLTRHGDAVSPIVWWRLLVIFGIAGTLFHFLWRARLGFWWAYSRLRLFSLVFPVVAVATCLVPGLYPRWMVLEQVLFSGVLLAVRHSLSAAPLRAAYVRPPKRPMIVHPAPPGG